MIVKKKASQNVLNAIDAVKASGAVVEERTIELMSLVDDGKITDNEAIEIVIKEEGLRKKTAII